MPKVYVHKSFVWLRPIAGALSLLFVIGAIIATWDQPDRMLPFMYLPLQISLMSFHANSLRCTVLTARVLWDSAGKSAPVSQITELTSVGRDRWLVKWSGRLKHQATFTLSPAMAVEVEGRINHVNLQTEDFRSSGLVPFSWVPILENTDLTPIRNQPSSTFIVPLFLVGIATIGLAFYFKLAPVLIVAPIAGTVLAFLAPRVGRILADDYLFEVNHKGVVRAMPVVGATIQRTKSNLLLVQGQEEALTVFHGGPIAAKLMGKSNPTKKKAAQEQQGHCLLCGESCDHMADGTVAVCRPCHNRVRHEAEMAGHGIR